MSSLGDKLRAFPLFKDARPETLERLSTATHAVSLRQGDALWRRGDEPTHAVLLLRGLVEVTRVTPDGEEVALALFGPRECPGLFAVVDGKIFPAGARCLSEESESLRVERRVLVSALEDDGAVSRAMSGVMGHHNAVLREKVDVLTAGEVPQRLATLFLLLTERFGDEGQPGELHVPLSLTRRVIARLVGVRVETVIRVLSRWEKERFVETTGEGFLIHGSERLRREASGAAADSNPT